jgi:hypothetical protein
MIRLIICVAAVGYLAITVKPAFGLLLILNLSAEFCCWVLYILCNFGIMLKRVTFFFINDKVNFTHKT